MKAKPLMDKTEDFILRAQEVHGDTYLYAPTRIHGYERNSLKVPIECREHGVFWQRPAEHLRGKGCKACGYARKRDFRRAREGLFALYVIRCDLHHVSKVYIGITKNPLEKRLSSHKYDANNQGKRSLAKAMRKYGTDHFTIEAIETELPWQTACNREREEIARRGRGNLWNDTSGGMGAPGMSESARLKIAIRRGAKRTTLVHESGDTFTGYPFEFQERYGVSSPGIAHLMSGKKGARTYKGWSLDGTTRAETMAARGLANSRSKTDAITWYHDDREPFNGTAAELITQYPDQGLIPAKLSAVRAGNNHEHAGWRITPEPPEKMTKWDGYRERGEAPPRRSEAVLWRHDDHGEFEGTAVELRSRFPEQKLNDSDLSLVKSGNHRHHRGWRVTETLVPAKPSVGNTKPQTDKIAWYHDDHGQFEGTAADLMKAFPDQKLARTNLSAVRLGKVATCKGWRITPEAPVKASRKGVPRKARSESLTWYHDDHGMFVGAISELTRAFPEQDLTQSTLSSVKAGRLRHHKGWRVTVELPARKTRWETYAENGGESPQFSTPVRWVHEELGEFHGTARQLMRRFPEHGLFDSNLSLVRAGRQSHHKGWTVSHITPGSAERSQNGIVHRLCDLTTASS